MYHKSVLFPISKLFQLILETTKHLPYLCDDMYLWYLLKETRMQKQPSIFESLSWLSEELKEIKQPNTLNYSSLTGTSLKVDMSHLPLTSHSYSFQLKWTFSSLNVNSHTTYLRVIIYLVLLLTLCVQVWESVCVCVLIINPMTLCHFSLNCT